MSRVTILSGPERRRNWTATEKLRILEESLAPGARVAEVARRHDVHPNQLHRWRRLARVGPGWGAGDGGARFAPLVIACEDAATTPKAAAMANAAAMPSRSANDMACPVEVMLRNGRVMRVPDHVALSWVASLADALEGQAR